MTAQGEGLPRSDRYYSDDTVTLLLGDAHDVLAGLPDESVDCIVTSPPYYGLRDYGTPGQYGLEETPTGYAETMRRVFAEARRVLSEEGTLWLNLGDSYSVRWSSERGAGRRGLNGDDDDRGRSGAITHGVPEKNLLGVPWRVAFALQDDGWILRNEIIWSKPNAMPEPVRDRLSTRHEHLFLFSKSRRYHFDLNAIRGHGANRESKGRNPGDVWSIATRPYPQAHFAVFPIDLPLRCIKAGCKPGGTVLDPFSGSGTTGAAARQLGRKYVGIDLNPTYHDLAKDRFAQGVLDLGPVA